MGLLTGQFAASLGMVEPGPTHSARVLPAEATTLAEHLRAAGFFTVGLTANPNLNRVFGFDQGFDIYADTRRVRGFAKETSSIRPDLCSRGSNSWIAMPRKLPSTCS